MREDFLKELGFTQPYDKDEYVLQCTALIRISAYDILTIKSDIEFKQFLANKFRQADEQVRKQLQADEQKILS